MYALGLVNMIFELRDDDKYWELSRSRSLEIVFLVHNFFK